MSEKRKSQQALISDLFKKRLVDTSTEKRVLSDSKNPNVVTEVSKSECENNSNIEVNDLHEAQEKRDNSFEIQDTTYKKNLSSK
jgi:hypothetical protein